MLELHLSLDLRPITMKTKLVFLPWEHKTAHHAKQEEEEKKKGVRKGKTKKNQTVWDKQGRMTRKSSLDVAVIRAKECVDSLRWLNMPTGP